MLLLNIITLNDKSVYKVFLGGDLHKRHKDISTISGYVVVHDAVQHELMNIISSKDIDLFISLGDWYDRGYSSDVSSALCDTDLDNEMSHLLHGNFYGVIGNHIRIGMDSNPELSLIQPHATLTTRKPVARKHQIIKTPDIIRVHDVQISIMHNQPDDFNPLCYKPERCEWAKYHIAIFHTPRVVPLSQLSSTRYAHVATNNSVIAQVIDGVDLAICGDIHNPLGMFNINTPNGVCCMIVPGSLTNTSSDIESRHGFVNLPILTIDDNSHVAISGVKVDLFINRLSFKQPSTMDTVTSLNGSRKVSSTRDADIVSVLKSNEARTFTEFLNANGYSSTDKNLIKSIIKQPEDIETLAKIYNELGGMI